MFDEIFDRGYQHSRSQLNAGIDRGIARIGRATMDTFRALHAIQFSSPWLADRRRIPHDA